LLDSSRRKVSIEVVRIEASVGIPPERWDETVCAFGGSFYHSTVWGEYQQKATGVLPIFLIRRDQTGSVTAGALALFRKSPRPIASLLSRSLVLTTHPFARDHQRDLCAGFVRECESYARSLGCISIGIDSFAVGQSDFCPSDLGYAETRRVEFCVDLRQSTDQLWKNISRDQRERIRRLSREGVSIEVGMDRDDLKGLKLAREFTQAKRSQQGQGYDLPDNGDFYETVFEYLVRRGAARLFLAKRGDEVVGAIFFAAFNNRASSIFSGSTELGYKLGAQSGLFWAAVESFKADGFQELNRGGVPESAAQESDPLHGIYRFKQRLGATPLVCRSGQKILSPLRERLLRLGRKIVSA
jgi:GNAT acetyltransferase-like protein